MGISGASGVFVALAIAVALGLNQERLKAERPGLIILVLFSLWGLVAPLIGAEIPETNREHGYRLLAGITGVLLLITAWVRMHSLNKERIPLIFWPTAIVVTIGGAIVLLRSFASTEAQSNLNAGLLGLVAVCAIQSFVIVVRVSRAGNAT